MIDERTITELFTQERDKMIRTAAKYVGYSAAEDVVQEAFITIFRTRDRLTDDRITSYSYMTVRSRALNQWHRSKRYPTEELTEVVDDAPYNTEQIAELDHALSVLNTLPEFQRNIVLDRALGYTYDELADRYGTTPGAVKVNVSRGRSALRKALEAGS